MPGLDLLFWFNLSRAAVEVVVVVAEGLLNRVDFFLLIFSEKYIEDFLSMFCFLCGCGCWIVERAAEEQQESLSSREDCLLAALAAATTAAADVLGFSCSLILRLLVLVYVLVLFISFKCWLEAMDEKFRSSSSSKVVSDMLISDWSIARLGGYRWDAGCQHACKSCGWQRHYLHFGFDSFSDRNGPVDSWRTSPGQAPKSMLENWARFDGEDGSSFSIKWKKKE